MEEGTNKAIPIRRRNGTRSVEVVTPRSWSETLGAGVWSVLGQPRQLWLASLGGVALTFRGLKTGWASLVSAGETVEGLLRSVLGSDAKPTT